MTLITEWRQWAKKKYPDGPPYVLDADWQAVKKLKSKGQAIHHTCRREAVDEERSPDVAHQHNRLHIGLIPQPFVGDLEKASIFLLMSNPGFRPADYFEYDDRDLQQTLLTTLRQAFPDGNLRFWPLDPRFAEHSGFCYWYEKLLGVIAELANAKGVTLAEARDCLASKLAVIQLLPYHSAKAPKWKALESLHSRKLAMNFVKQLVQKKKVTIVVPRGEEPWRNCLTSVESHANVVYGTSRAVSLRPGTLGGNAILKQLGVPVKDSELSREG